MQDGPPCSLCPGTICPPFALYVGADAGIVHADWKAASSFRRH